MRQQHEPQHGHTQRAARHTEPARAKLRHRQQDMHTGRPAAHLQHLRLRRHLRRNLQGAEAEERTRLHPDRPAADAAPQPTAETKAGTVSGRPREVRRDRDVRAEGVRPAGRLHGAQDAGGVHDLSRDQRGHTG